MLPAASVNLTPGQPFPAIPVEKMVWSGSSETYYLDKATQFEKGQHGVIITLPHHSDVNDTHLEGFKEEGATLARLNCQVVVITSVAVHKLWDLNRSSLESARLYSDEKGHYGQITGAIGTPYKGHFSCKRSCVVVKDGIVAHVAVEADDDACTVTSAKATIAKIKELVKWTIGKQLPDALGVKFSDSNTSVTLSSHFGKDELGVIVSVPYLHASWTVPDTIRAYDTLPYRVIVITTAVNPVLERWAEMRSKYCASAGKITFVHDRYNRWARGTELVHRHPGYTIDNVYHPFCVIVKNGSIVDFTIEPHDSLSHIIPAALAASKINARS